MNKQRLGDMLSNGEVCCACSNIDHCAELNVDCKALLILRELTGYPSFDHSQINCVDNSRSDSKLKTNHVVCVEKKTSIN